MQEFISVFTYRALKIVTLSTYYEHRTYRLIKVQSGTDWNIKQIYRATDQMLLLSNKGQNSKSMPKL